jgi:hypothetical protein
VRARLVLATAKDPGGMTLPFAARETLAFVRMLHRYGSDVFEEE